MTPCAMYRDQVEAYLAGRLASTACRSVEQHAATCAACYVVLERATRPVLPVDADVPPSLLVAVTKEMARHRPLRPWVPRQLLRVTRGRTALAACAATLLLWVGVVRTSPEPVVPDAVAPTTYDPHDQLWRHARALAESRAVGERQALDSAAAELQRALVQTPADSTLLGYLRDVEHAQQQLSRRLEQPLLVTTR